MVDNWALPKSRRHSFASRFEVYLQYEGAEPLHVGGAVAETAAVNKKTTF